MDDKTEPLPIDQFTDGELLREHTALTELLGDEKAFLTKAARDRKSVV